MTVLFTFAATIICSAITSGGAQFITIANPPLSDETDFGLTVAALGNDMALVTAKKFDWENTGQHLGLVHLYDATGTLLRTFMNPAPAENGYDFQFGYAVTGVGDDKVLVGAPLDNTGAFYAGVAYLFDLQGNLLNTFTNPTPEVNDQFGLALRAFSPDKIFIMAWKPDYVGELYRYNTQGQLLTTFTNPSPYTTGFGCVVDLVGDDKIVIGTDWDQEAYLFDLQGQLVTTFTKPWPNEHPGGIFGVPVAAIGDDKVLVADFRSDVGTMPNAGAAFLFDLQGSFLSAFVDPSPMLGDDFGYAFAMLGTNRIAIGAPGAAGSVHIYDYQGNILETINNPTPNSSSEGFGSSLAALGSNRLIVGANGDSQEVYIFQLSEEPPTLRILATATNTIVLTWPSVSAGYVLQEKGSLNATWTDVAQSVVDDGTSNFVTVVPQSGIRFYRLQK